MVRDDRRRLRGRRRRTKTSSTCVRFAFERRRHESDRRNEPDQKGFGSHLRSLEQSACQCAALLDWRGFPGPNALPLAVQS